MTKAKVKVLHLESHAVGTAQLPSDRPVITRAFDAVGVEGHVETLRSPSLADLTLRVNSGNYDAVHFSGHGSARQGLLLTGPAGDLQSLGATGLRGILRGAHKPPRVAILAACYSLQLAREAASFVPCAIGAQGDLDDAVARRFIEMFYGSLGTGRSVAVAFEQAEAACSDETAFGGLWLEVNPRADAHQVFLVANASRADVPALLQEGRRLLQLGLYDQAASRFSALARRGDASAADGHYNLVLAKLRGRHLAGVPMLNEIRDLERHLATAVSLKPEAHYYVLWAWIKRDLDRRGLYVGGGPTWSDLLQQAAAQQVDLEELHDLAMRVGIRGNDPTLAAFGE